MSVLVDTSVWVSHFRQHDQKLMDLLSTDQVLIHPLIIGELACGTPPRRGQTLADLALLRRVIQATQAEVLGFIEKRQLFGLGCGWIDINLLASTKLTPGAKLWTHDKRLAKLASRFDLALSTSDH